MTTLYADVTRLRLATGDVLDAYVRIAEGDGARPKCVLLHGNPGSLQDFARTIPRLSRAADIAAIDLPGFGRSAGIAPDGDALSLEGLADSVVAALNTLDWHEPVFVIGHSHGGGVAQVVAARYPERVASLVLVGTLGASVHASYRLLSLPGAHAVARGLGRMLRVDGLRRLNRVILRRVMADIFSPDSVPEEQLEQQLELLAARPEILSSMVHVTRGRPCQRLARSAAEIRCPTLFIHGSHDAIVPAKCARAIHDCIANNGGLTHFHVLQGAGHMLLHHQALEFVDIVTEHLRDVLAAPSAVRVSADAAARTPAPAARARPSS